MFICVLQVHKFFKVSSHLQTLVRGQCTIADGGPGIMAKIFGAFGTKICYFIKKNMTKNGPLVFCTVFCSKYDKKLGNCQRKTLR